MADELNNPSKENVLWLQRLLTRFQRNSPEIVNPDEWFSSLLDKPVEQTNVGNIRPHVPGTRPMFNQIHSDSDTRHDHDTELLNLIEQLAEWADERNNSTGSSPSREEIFMAFAATSDASGAINNIHNYLLDLESEYNRTANVSTEEGIACGDNSCASSESWIDALLRLNTHMVPNASTSNNWISTLLNQPSCIPSNIPRMDLTRTSALPLCKLSQDNRK